MKKSKFICCYLEENFGMTVYNSKEEFVENFAILYLSFPLNAH